MEKTDIDLGSHCTLQSCLWGRPEKSLGTPGLGGEMYLVTKTVEDLKSGGFNNKHTKNNRVIGWGVPNARLCHLRFMITILMFISNFSPEE